MDIAQHPMPTLVINASGEVCDANDPACALMGLPRDQLRGAVMERVFFAVDGGPTPERFLGDLMTLGQGRFDGMILAGPGGQQRVTAWGYWPERAAPSYWVHLWPAPAPTRGSSGGLPAVGAPKDLFAHLSGPFRAVLSQPRQAEALLRLGGGMSVHARDLLSTLLKLAQVLRGQLGGQPHLAGVTHVASALSKDAERLAELTGTAGELTPEAQDLHEALGSTVMVLEAVAPPTIHVVLNVDAQVPKIYCHPLGLQQALLTLANHAFEGMPQGGQLFLSGRTGQQDGMVDIVVRDTGQAMGPLGDEEDGRRMPQGGGERMGMERALPLVRDLMDRMGGDVTVASSAHAGTSMTLSLPAGEDHITNANAEVQRVLVVDDDEELRRVTARMIEHSGFAVTTAADGAEALELLSGEVSYAALLLDLHMPRAGGMDVMSFVRVMSNPPAVVVFTADDVNSLWDELHALGAHAAMSKPFLGRELIATLKEAIRDHKV